jgi:hypothetical protein
LVIKTLDPELDLDPQLENADPELDLDPQLENAGSGSALN